MTVALTVAGALLILLAIFDLFETMFDPEDQGRITNGVSLLVWRVFKLLPLRTLGYAGPFAYFSVLATWTIMMVLGWALIYLPQLPEGFSLDRGLEEGEQTGFGTALYLSLVTMGTLGYGDITPTTTWLRIVAPAESLVGFLLISAAITWILVIYQDIELRRVLSHETTLLMAAIEDSNFDLSELNPDSIERLIDEATKNVVRVTGSLHQFPITYFFRIKDDRQSLAAMSLFLLELSEELRREILPKEVRLHGRMLAGALDHLAEALADRCVAVEEGATTRQILRAYAHDHRREINFERSFFGD